MREAINQSCFKCRRKEKVVLGIQAYGLYFALGYLFFRHIGWSLLVGFLGYYQYRQQCQVHEEKKKEAFMRSFMEAIYSLSASISAGRSVEGAFIQSLGELERDHLTHEMLLKEWQDIVKKLKNNEPIDGVLEGFSTKIQVEEVQNFISVFIVAYLSGGDLVSLTRQTLLLLKEKQEIKQEIRVLVAQKRYEQKVMAWVIPAMILLFWCIAPHFIDPLYKSIYGRVMMLLALALYMLSDYIGRRIISIKV